MSEREYLSQPPTCVRARYSLMLASAIVLTSAGLLHAQSPLPAIGTPSGFTGTTAGSTSNATSDTHTDFSPSHHTGSSATTPFKIPHTISKTTDSGTKFKFTLPRVGFAAGQRLGQISPLDSNGMQSMGSRGSATFPSDNNNFLQPTNTASDGLFGTSSDGMSGVAGMSRGGHGGGMGRGGGGAGDPGLSVKNSIFDFHVGMSMKDMMGGSFAQSGGGGASAGSGFSMSGSNAGDFNSTGGLRTPGSEGRGAGAGPKLSLGLRF